MSHKNKMIVLWFSNTAASGAHILNISGLGGGWLASLDREIANDVELHIAFDYPKKAKTFVTHDIHFHPVCLSNWRWYMLLSQFGIYPSPKKMRNKYISLIKHINPDIIHIHGTENQYGCILSEIQIPTIVSIQGNISVLHHMFMIGLGEKCIKKWVLQYGSNPFNWVKSFKSAYKRYKSMAEYEQKYLKEAKWIMGRTHWDRRISRVLAPASEYVRGEEILRQPFYIARWSKPNLSSLVLHTTTSDNAYKGFETLAETLALLADHGLSIQWQVAGLSDKSLVVRLVKKRMGNRYPAEYVRLLGGRTDSELVADMQRAHVFILPSHIENSPNSLCEAMIIGMPCIASFAGGTSSLLKDGEEGLLVQSGDPWVLAGAVLEIVNNYDEAIEMGLRARRRALEKHNPQSIRDHLLETYSMIIRHAGSRTP
jgi:glycosyltransferase involved in cell wall biosynthesis